MAQSSPLVGEGDEDSEVEVAKEEEAKVIVTEESQRKISLKKKLKTRKIPSAKENAIYVTRKVTGPRTAHSTRISTRLSKKKKNSLRQNQALPQPKVVRAVAASGTPVRRRATLQSYLSARPKPED
jgi:hypothetical protein